jgi:hypothetical protein
MHSAAAKSEILRTWGATMLRPYIPKRKAPASEGGLYKSKRNPRTGLKTGHYKTLIVGGGWGRLGLV